jgi:hypothetical protein
MRPLRIPFTHLSPKSSKIAPDFPNCHGFTIPAGAAQLRRVPVWFDDSLSWIGCLHQSLPQVSCEGLMAIRKMGAGSAGRRSGVCFRDSPQEWGHVHPVGTKHDA